jgi:hypothetical protein
MRAIHFPLRTFTTLNRLSVLRIFSYPPPSFPLEEKTIRILTRVYLHRTFACGGRDVKEVDRLRHLETERSLHLKELH